MRRPFQRALLLAFVPLFLVLASACSTKTAPKTFTVESMSITLTNAFAEEPMLLQTAYFESDDALVTVLKERNAALDPTMTLTEYAESVIQLNKLDQLNSFVKTDGELVYFTFEQEIFDKDCWFAAFVYKNNDVFWMVQFACDINDATEMEPLFFEYARSVSFAA